MPPVLWPRAGACCDRCVRRLSFTGRPARLFESTRLARWRVASRLSVLCCPQPACRLAGSSVRSAWQATQARDLDPIPGPSPSGKGALCERGPGGGGRWRVSPVRLSCSILFSTSGNQARHPCGGFSGLEERFCRTIEWPSIYKGSKARFSARIRRVRVWNVTKLGCVWVWKCGSVGVWECGSMGVWGCGSVECVRRGEAFAEAVHRRDQLRAQTLRPVGPPPTTSHLFCGTPGGRSAGPVLATVPAIPGISFYDLAITNTGRRIWVSTIVILIIWTKSEWWLRISR